MKELKVIATPIGCLSDVSVRAKAFLEASDAIICENRARCRKLLSALGIKGKFIAVYSADSIEKAGYIFSLLSEKDKCVFIVSAGTPAVSDPGHLLIKETVKRGVAVSPVPGPTAIGALLSVCPRKIKDFIFAGFLPKKKESLRKALAGYFKQDIPVIAFSTKRDVRRLSSVLGEYFPVSQVFAGREMTKKFEEYVFFENIADFKSWTENIKGEITLIIFPQEIKSDKSESYVTTSMQIAEKF